MGERILLSSPHMSEEGYEKEFIQEAFDTNWIAPLGNNVDAFEMEMKQYVGANAIAALNTGTSAIHMALKAVGVQKDDIVFCQSLTFSATANPIIYQNAIPVFIDSDYETWNMSANALESAFQKYERLGKVPKAVIGVHLYGNAAQMDELLSICRQRNVPFIEDAAESLGTLYKGKYTGTLGDYGVYSFNGNKIITTSGGGMLISQCKEAIDKVKFWSTQAKEPARHYQHNELGYNYRMSNVLAGIGRGQLMVLSKRIQKKQEIYQYYKEYFKEITDISMIPENEWCESNHWLSCIRLDGKVSPLDVIIQLEKKNIESRPIWKPMHLQPFYSQCDYIGEDVAETIYKTGVCLPSDTKLTKEQLEQVCTAISALW